MYDRAPGGLEQVGVKIMVNIKILIKDRLSALSDAHVDASAHVRLKVHSAARDVRLAVWGRSNYSAYAHLRDEFKTMVQKGFFRK